DWSAVGLASSSRCARRAGARCGSICLSPGREPADGDLQAGLGGGLGQPRLPQVDAGAVRPAGVPGRVVAGNGRRSGSASRSSTGAVARGSRRAPPRAALAAVGMGATASAGSATVMGILRWSAAVLAGLGLVVVVGSIMAASGAGRYIAGE